MGNYLAVPALAVLSGGVGFALRFWQLRSAFEDGTGLPVPGAPATLALVLVTVAVMLLMGGVLWRMCRRAPVLTYDQAFLCKNSLMMTMDVVCAMLLAGGGLLILWDYLQGNVPNLFHCVLAALLVGAGGCVLFTGRNNYRGMGEGKFNGFLLLPAYAFCLRLILTYQTVAGDPVILDYVFRILAIITSLLGLYFTAGFSFEKGKALCALWTGLMAVYFSAVSLADLRGWADAALFAFSIVYFTAHSGVLLRNLTAEREE